MAAPAQGLGTRGRTADESELLRALDEPVARFAQANIKPLQIDREHKIPPAVLSGLAELGLFGLSIPEAYGGAGLSLQGVCGAVIGLARVDRSVATTVGLHLGLGTRGLIAFGSEALRAAHLPALAAGTKIGAFAATEAGAGSDLAAIATKVAEAGPGLLRVDGSKIYVTNGGLAHVFTIAAASPGLGGNKKGHTLLLLERGDAGLSPEGEEQKLGLRGSSTTSLHLDGVTVPEGRIVGVPGRGMEQLHHVLAWGRTAMAAGCVGAGRAAVDAALAHTSTRKQFGRTLDAFEIVRGQLADLEALLFAMEALVRWTCAAEADHGELAARSTAAKVFCSEGDWELCDTAVQLHGGAGFIEETGLPLLLRDARITRIFEGANDVLLAAHGAREAGAPSPRAALDGQVAPALQPAASIADWLDASIGGLRAELRARFGVRLMAQQRRLHALGRLAVLREATDAAVLRAQAEGTPEAARHAAWWAGLARRRAAPLLEAPLPFEPADAGARG